jgi:hypothetical protein
VDYRVRFLVYATIVTYSDFFFQCVGLRVAQVRLLFNLPPQFGRFPHPLAYIEWFTNLGSPDLNTGLHSVTRSTRHGKRNAEVVSVDRIVRGCHLMPRFGQAINSTWTTDNILEQSSLHYFVNPYINIETFTLLKPALFNE